ncbi:threonine ammonia-lyase [Rhodobacteraceae bacterium RKSG542]|uniref:threonine ammonia-lyase n=1 Tax=Pseudovibrio flavus TaxID=2529854 RepID=UPI0012BBF43E|nr:threonine ammonia-lyase [Pseudovibrio flavus]MTI17389.1 threonine ammonia-lyase [Pseudovibrio flavus]
MTKTEAPQTIGLEHIQKAARQIEGAVLRTPLLAAPRLEPLTGTQIFVKYENMQVTNAFKERGALNKLLALTPEERKTGVIAMSAGNHAQAVARHATLLGIPAVIVMPETTPHVKVAATEGFGAKVVLAGESVDQAREEADRLAKEHGYTWVHPFDDPYVIAGQGTIALEMLEDQPDLDAIVIPVGGGGMIAGMATAIKALRPDIEVIGVETELYPSMYNALKGEALKTGGSTLAEGIAVHNVGTLTRELVLQHVDDIVLVTETQIEQAVNAYLTLQKTIAEGAGGAGLAAVMANKGRFAGKKVGLVLCGGNIDPRLLTSIMLRELVRDGHIISIRCTIPDRPGLLGEISTLIGHLGGNILDVSHHRLFLEVPAKGATLDVTIETRGIVHAEEIVEGLRERGIDVQYRASAELRN